MKKLMIGIAAAAALLMAAPAMAQLGIRAGEDGVSVQVGRNHDGRRAYGWDRGHHYGWYRDRACARVTVRERLPNGNVIVRTRERC